MPVFNDFATADFSVAGYGKIVELGWDAGDAAAQQRSERMV
jgi:hypothetical protein